MENMDTLDVFVVFLDRGVYDMWCWHGDDMENTDTLDIFVVFLDRGVSEMWC